MTAFSFLKKYSLLAACAAVMCAGSMEASAQKYSFDPSSKQMSGALNGASSLDLHIKVKNETSSSLALTWHMLSEQIPDEWGPQFCDNNTCYAQEPGTPLPKTADFLPIGPGETADMKMSMYPNGLIPNPNIVVRFGVGEAGGPITDTVTYNISLVTSYEEIPAEGSFTITPSPVGSSLLAELPEGTSSVRIYSALGVQFGEETVNGTSLRLGTESLPAGTYFLVALDKDGKAFARKFQKN